MEPRGVEPPAASEAAVAAYVIQLEAELGKAQQALAERDARLNALEGRIRAAQDAEARAALRLGDIQPGGETLVEQLAREVVQLRRIVAEPGRLDVTGVAEFLGALRAHRLEPDGRLWLHGHREPIGVRTSPLPAWLAVVVRNAEAEIQEVRAAHASIDNQPPTSPAGVRSLHPAGSSSPTN